jgi:oxygen-dependent protoporphyrinogen oxidase
VTATYCVVGGGISGLTAAYRLRVAAGEGATITLFDPADRLGGVLRTIQLGGQPMDVGAEAFVARRPEVPALMTELGLAEALVDTTGARPLIYAGGGLHPLPVNTVSGIPTSADSLAGLVDAETVAKVSGEPARPLSWRRGADPAVGEIVADRLGMQVVTRCVDPLLAGVYAGSAASIGLRSAAPGVAAALDRGAGSLTEAARAALPPDSASAGPVFRAVGGGYRVLVDKLAQRGGVRWIRRAIKVLDGQPGGWRLRDSEG